jgi:spoIIIJ-associated protein
VEMKREIEMDGSSVDEAIAAGLEALGVERDAVEIEVLDEGSRGILGLGSRPARVRLLVKEKDVAKEAPSVSPTPAPAPEPAPVAEVEVQAADEVPPEDEVPPVDGLPATTPTIEDELRSVAPVARQTLEELLEQMGIRAQIEDYIKKPLDEEDYYKLVLNVQGRDLGFLIGRRGETLEALQYLTRLIVGREVERRVNLVVDVEGYRVRRERSLQQLAQRMAERTVTTGRRQVLEPMSAAERRIVHVALRHHADVMTESIGQDENRKVTIFLRENK